MKYWKPILSYKTHEGEKFFESNYEVEKLPDCRYHGKPKNIPIATDIYAVAYEIDNNTNRACLRCEPTKGQIIHDPKSGCDYRFAPYNKSGTELLKSGRVDFQSRYYADTLEEAKEMYNFLIESRIKQLENLIEITKQDMIL